MIKNASALALAICLLTCGCKPSKDKSAPDAADYNYAPSWMGGQRLLNITPKEQKDGVTSVEAFESHKIAALKEDPLAQYALGLDFLIGRGTPKDEIAASKWFIKSANQGNISAQKVVAIMYGTGTGVEKNLTLSLTYWILIRDNLPDSLFAEPALPQIDEAFLASKEAKEVVVLNGKKMTKGDMHITTAMMGGLDPVGIAQREIALILEKISGTEVAVAKKKATDLASQIKSKQAGK